MILAVSPLCEHRKKVAGPIKDENVARIPDMLFDTV